MEPNGKFCNLCKCSLMKPITKLNLLVSIVFVSVVSRTLSTEEYQQWASKVLFLSEIKQNLSAQSVKSKRKSQCR